MTIDETEPRTAEMPGQDSGVGGGQRLDRPGMLGRLMTPVQLALIDLVLLAAAEIVTALVDPKAGLVLHGGLLVILLVQSAAFSRDTQWVWLPVRDRPGLRVATAVSHGAPARGLFLTLAFAPLMRLMIYALPLSVVPQVYWYAAISLPLFLAAVLAARTLGLAPAGVGLQGGTGLPLQALIGLSGLVLGYLQYQILAPAPLAAVWTLRAVWLPALVLLICTGLLEELIFRGLMLRTAGDTLGRFAVPYIAVVFAVLHVGYRSAADVVFAAAVGLFFGWVAATTRSILGVALAHGLTNIMLFLVLPLTPLGGQLTGTSPVNAASAMPPAVALALPANLHPCCAGNPTLGSPAARRPAAGRNGGAGGIHLGMGLVAAALPASRRFLAVARPGRADGTRHAGCTGASSFTGNRWRSLAQDADDPGQCHQSEAQKQGNQDDAETIAESLGPGTRGRAHHLFLDKQCQQNEDGNQAQRAGQDDIGDGDNGGCGDRGNHGDSEALPGENRADKSAIGIIMFSMFRPRCQVRRVSQ